jgi:hypothetical protein
MQPTEHWQTWEKDCALNTLILLLNFDYLLTKKFHIKILMTFWTSRFVLFCKDNHFYIIDKENKD